MIKKTSRKRRSSQICFSHAAEAGIMIAVFIICLFLIRLILQALFRPVALINSSPIFTGVNGYGTIESYHPEESAIKELQEEEEKLSREHKDTSTLHQLISSISCGFSQAESLENGEIITYGCHYDQAAALKAGYLLKNTDQSFQVNGLRAIKKIDPFDEIHVSINQDHKLNITFSDRFKDITIDYEYSFIDVNHVNIHLLYDADDAARAGYRFVCSEKMIVIPADYLVFDEDGLSHLDQHQKEILNKAVWELPLSSMIQKIDLYGILPGSTRITESPILERWEINEDGQLEIIYTVNGYDAEGKHTWKITVAFDITGILEDTWKVSPAEPYTYDVKDIETLSYYHSKRTQGK